MFKAVVYNWILGMLPNTSLMTHLFRISSNICEKYLTHLHPLDFICIGFEGYPHGIVST